LLLEIAEWVGTDAYHPSLVNIITVRGTRFLGPPALCSRRLNTIVSPLLYRMFIQTNTKALPAFLRLALERPQIGEEVKKLMATELPEDTKLDMSGWSPQDFERCRTAIDSFDDLLILKSGWVANVEQGIWDAIVALLLLFLPKLEEIEMAFYYGRVPRGREFSYRYIIQTFKYVASNQSFEKSPYSLKHPKTISAAYPGSIFKYGMDLDLFLPFFTPPSVSKVLISRVCEGSFWAAPPRRYQVPDLRFDNCSLNGDTVIKFLRWFTSIRKFHYVHGDGSVGYHLFLPQKNGRSSSSPPPLS
jgi:hypothetical protein